MHGISGPQLRVQSGIRRSRDSQLAGRRLRLMRQSWSLHEASMDRFPAKSDGRSPGLHVERDRESVPSYNELFNRPLTPPSSCLSAVFRVTERVWFISILFRSERNPEE